jgi:replicative DNA helicase
VSAKNAKTHDESLLLAAILKSGKDGFIDCSDIVNERHFDSFLNKIIFSSYENIFNNNQKFKLTSVISEAMRMGVDKDDIPKMEKTLSVDVDTAVIRQTAMRLRNIALLKESQLLHQNCIKDLSHFSGDENLNKIFSVSESAIFDLIKKYSDGDDSPVVLGSEARSIVEDWEANPADLVGLPTGWTEFDLSIGGGLRTGVHLIGARSGVGKSFLGQIASLFLSQAGFPCLILDTEMQYKEVLPRFVANLSEIEINEIETGKFGSLPLSKQKVYNAVSELEKRSVYHKSVAGLPFDEILSIIRRWIYKEVGIKKDGKANKCAIVYDYFKLMSMEDAGDMAEFQALGFQISKMTDFTKKYDIPCLSFVQLNRDGIDKESTAVISQSDRLLWLANSFSIFKHKTMDEMAKDGFHNGNRKLITLKSRYGGEHEMGQYISMQMRKEIAYIKEVGLFGKQEPQQIKAEDDDIEI